MVPTPKEFKYDFWLSSPLSEDLDDVNYSDITVTFLMPNGIVILLKVKYDATLAEIKEVSTKSYI